MSTIRYQCISRDPAYGGKLKDGYTPVYFKEYSKSKVYKELHRGKL